MKKLLNTLYVTSEDSYLALDGENIVVKENETEIGRVPLHNLQGIVAFGYRGTSPALMGACAQRNISLCYLTPQGQFLARVTGEIRGNVLLRERQYQVSQDESICLDIARNCIIGKVYNARWVLERTIRDHPMQVDTEAIEIAIQKLKNILQLIQTCTSRDQLRGFEGDAANAYFSVFDEMILQQKRYFRFGKRSRRPPLNAVNALLSFAYTLQANSYAAALETVGLDPYIGFMHTERPGRMSLALDMMEELRSVFADRFVLTLINKRMVNASQFCVKENGAVMMNDESRRLVLTEWQKRKKEVLVHPYLKEKVEWGMLPFVQATLLARYLRGDLDAYPPFLWK